MSFCFNSFINQLYYFQYCPCAVSPNALGAGSSNAAGASRAGGDLRGGGGLGWTKSQVAFLTKYKFN